VLHEPQANGRARVVACTATAAAQGIRPGQPLVEALSLAGRAGLTLHQLPADPSAEHRELERLAQLCQQFTPEVGLVEPFPSDSLQLDLTSCQRLYPCEDRLRLRVREFFAREGYLIRLALAGTLGAAWALARFGHLANLTRNKNVHDFWAVDFSITWAETQSGPALAALPVEGLRLSSRTVHWLRELGLTSVGQLEALPRSSVPARFGPELLLRLDQLRGRQPELWTRLRPLPHWQATWELEEPTAQLAALEYGLAQVLEQLLAWLNPLGLGLVRWQIDLLLETKSVVTFVVGLSRPQCEPRVLLGLAREHGQRLTIPARVQALRGTALEAARLEITQQTLFDERSEREAQRQREALLDRLSNRLGEQAVLRPALAADAQPERAQGRTPWLLPKNGRENIVHEKDPIKKRGEGESEPPPQAGILPPGFRPVRLLAPPQAVRVWTLAPEGSPVRVDGPSGEQVVQQAWGPERIVTGWWRTPPIARDYYRVQLASGQRLWLFRQLADGAWFLHGFFD